jgi:hypothetical protein
LDELVGSAGQAASAVSLVYETLHVLRNRLGQMSVKLPLEALLVFAFQHHEKGRGIFGAAIA